MHYSTFYGNLPGTIGRSAVLMAGAWTEGAEDAEGSGEAAACPLCTGKIFTLKT